VKADGWSPDESRQGTVSRRTYAAYVSAAGGVVTVAAVLVASVVAEGAKAFSFWWLAYWLKQGSGSANVSQHQFVVSCVIIICCIIIRLCRMLSVSSGIGRFRQGCI